MALVPELVMVVVSVVSVEGMILVSVLVFGATGGRSGGRGSCDCTSSRDGGN